MNHITREGLIRWKTNKVTASHCSCKVLMGRNCLKNVVIFFWCATVEALGPRRAVVLNTSEVTVPQAFTGFSGWNIQVCLKWQTTLSIVFACGCALLHLWPHLTIMSWCAATPWSGEKLKHCRQEKQNKKTTRLSGTATLLFSNKWSIWITYGKPR